MAVAAQGVRPLGLGPRVAHHSSELSFRDVACFVIPALIAIEIKVVGRLFLSEILLLGALPLLLMDRDRRPFPRGLKILLILGLIWLWGQVLTDLYRASVFVDFSRGWVRIAFTLINLLAMFLLIDGNRRRIILFAGGIAVGSCVQYFLNPNFFADVEPWKFGYGPPITMAVVLLAIWQPVYRWRLLSPALLVAIGVVNLGQNYRSLAGICFLTAGYILLQQLLLSARLRRARISAGRVVLLVGAGLVLSVTALSAYGYAAKRGYLGAEASSKYEYQSSGRFGVLLGGRPQVIAEVKAIGDAPILGHGSWAKDRRYSLQLINDLLAAGYRSDPATLYGLTHTDYIPTHSYLLGAWVEAGILGTAFWIGVIVISAGVVFTYYRVSDSLTPLLMFLTIGLAWNLLFSPYGAEQRITVPFAIVVLLYAQARIAESATRSASSPPAHIPR